MKKKSIIIFAAAAVFSVGLIIYSWSFVDRQIGEVTLTEETASGNKEAAAGLTAGFRADSADDLHWISSFDYSTDRTESSFTRGEMAKKTDAPVYDDIRFTGWSAVPYVTQLKYDRLEGLQQKAIHAFYDEIQRKVLKTGSEEKGKIRLGDYLDYYPVSFAFQFGTRAYSSDDALTGLKVYEENGRISANGGAAYDGDVDLYTALNKMFRIPVIENEYQEYKVSKAEDHDAGISPGYETEVEKPLGEGEDLYEFDPVIVIQEETVMDSRKWVHPDLSGGLSYEAGDMRDDSYVGRSASEYDLKNRMLFIVNNRTAKGAPVDVSQIEDGYGVYELPIEVTSTAKIRKGKKSVLVPDPKPLSDELAMVYPLDKTAEYVEMSLSGDHRYLAVFSVKDGAYFVDMVDADTWTSKGPSELFPASEKMTYTWGDDGTLAVTNHEGYVAVLTRTGEDSDPYQILWCGKAGDDLDRAFFDTEMVSKEHSYARYKCGIDTGLAVAEKDGKVALVQSLLVGAPAGGTSFSFRNAALACAVLDKSGLIYRGRLKSNIVDLEYDMSGIELQTARDLLDGKADSKAGSAAFDAAGYVIRPVRNENWCRWE